MVCRSGQRAKSASSPAQTASSTALNPKQTPRMCGTVRLNPKLAPDAVNMTLLGPGVMDMTNEYVAKANGSTMELQSSTAGFQTTEPLPHWADTACRGTSLTVPADRPVRRSPGARCGGPAATGNGAAWSNAAEWY